MNGWLIAQGALALQAWHGGAAPAPFLHDIAVRQQPFWRAALAWSHTPQVRLIHPASWLCRPQCLLQQQGQALYRDEQHLNAWGAQLAVPWLARELGLAASPMQP